MTVPRLRLQRLSVPAVLTAIVVLFVADAALERAGNWTLGAGACDETAHALTTLLVLWALGERIYRRYAGPALLASVLIDLDHLPAQFGSQWLTAGTPRPYTHSLSTVVLVIVLALLWRRRRAPLFAVAIGLMIHFWRDMAEPGTGVALLWPLSDASFSYPHAVYLAAMVAIGVAALVRSARAARRPEHGLTAHRRPAVVPGPTTRP